MEDVVGVSHECDFPSEANARPRGTKWPVHDAGLASKDVDEWVRRALRENGTIYTIDEPLLRELRPDVILTQKLCDVCAVGYGTVARLAEALPGPPQVVNLEPSSVSDIFDDIRRIARACDVAERGKELVTKLSARLEIVRERAAHVAVRPRCFLMEWVDPPFCSAHWGPELVEIAGGHDPLGRMTFPRLKTRCHRFGSGQPPQPSPEAIEQRLWSAVGSAAPHRFSLAGTHGSPSAQCTRNDSCGKRRRRFACRRSPKCYHSDAIVRMIGSR